jgi:hypothetical protein
MPYKTKQSEKAYMQRYRILQDLKKLDNYALMNCLATAETAAIARVVGVEFDSPKGKYIAHLSVLAAADGKKYKKTLKAMKFPYKVEFGDYFVIKRANDVDIEGFAKLRKQSLEELLAELQSLRDRSLKAHGERELTSGSPRSVGT